MRKSVKILFGLFVCLAATTGHAQKIASENGKVIIDSSAIPHVTTKKARTTTATPRLKGSNTADDIASQVSNSLVYYKFEVGQVSTDRLSWNDAILACANKTDTGGGWRLPTQRELQLMVVLSPELEQFGLFKASEFWSATEWKGQTGNVGAQAYRVKVDTRAKGYEHKFSLYDKYTLSFYRCIRDLD